MITALRRHGIYAPYSAETTPQQRRGACRGAGLPAADTSPFAKKLAALGMKSMRDLDALRRLDFRTADFTTAEIETIDRMLSEWRANGSP